MEGLLNYYHIALYLVEFYFGDWRFEIKIAIIKLTIINAHAHSNAHVHQIVKLKTTNYKLHLYGKITKIKHRQYGTFLVQYICYIGGSAHMQLYHALNE